MDKWPASWAGDDDDIPIGRDLVGLLRPFVSHLQLQLLSSRTRRRHLDNLWLIGGEIIRQLHEEPALRRKKPALKLLLYFIQDGEAHFVSAMSEQQQRALDATARKLFYFLKSL